MSENTDLVNTLRGLKGDLTLAVQLYQQLAVGKYWAIIEKGSPESVASMKFLTYPSIGGVRELPIYTMEEFIHEFNLPNSEVIVIDAVELWPRMLDIVENGVCEVAVDPSQDHGIRLRREMILAIIHG